MSPSDVVTHMSVQDGLSPRHVRGPRRDRHVTICRIKIAFALRAIGLSFPAIGRELGGRHHATIMYYMKPQAWWGSALRELAEGKRQEVTT